MVRIRKAGRNVLRVDSELGSIRLETPLSDQNFLFIETDLGTVKIRMNVQDQGGDWLESVEIQPNNGVKIEGDSMVVLRRRKK